MISRARLAKTRYLGSACTGLDGAASRTLTHSKPLLSDSFIFINGRMMHLTDEYTVVGGVITFIAVIFDTDIIVVGA